MVKDYLLRSRKGILLTIGGINQMVKPNESQSILLEDLRFLVIEIMSDMEIWQDFDLVPLQKIRLGLLRKNATQRHGVTRWNRGITADLSLIHISEPTRPY